MDQESLKNAIQERMQNVVARNVTSARLAAGVNRKDLAEKSGLSQNTITAIESGKAKLRFETIAALAVALGCDPLMFFLDDSLLNFLMLLLLDPPEELFTVKFSVEEIISLQDSLNSGPASALYDAAERGKEAASKVSGDTGTKVGAAIGTTFMPGIGTAIGAAFGRHVGYNRLTQNAIHAYRRLLKNRKEGETIYGVE